MPGPDLDAYLCGSPPFAESIAQALKAWGVSDERDRSEAFAPGDARKAAASLEPGTGPLVSFTRSGVTERYNDAAGSLLAFAESMGINAPFSCRAGICHTCAAPLVEGAVTYMPDPSPSHPRAAPCWAVHADRADRHRSLTRRLQAELRVTADRRERVPFPPPRLPTPRGGSAENAGTSPPQDSRSVVLEVYSAGPDPVLWHVEAVSQRLPPLGRDGGLAPVIGHA